ncbi:MAG: hypothetical protein RML56_07035 [Burkholderiales bacterium]|nr:hypothetical protein [Burkholderiales bacterium]
MVRREFVARKLHLIAEDLERLLRFKDESVESLRRDDLKLAAVERFLERIVMRAIDVNEHLLSELASGEGRTSRLTYRDTFLLLAGLGVSSAGVRRTQSRAARVCATSSFTTTTTPIARSSSARSGRAFRITTAISSTCATFSRGCPARQPADRRRRAGAAPPIAPFLIPPREVRRREERPAQGRIGVVCPFPGTRSIRRLICV